VLLHRRLIAALAAGGAVLVGLQAAAPPPPETATVWTAVRDLSGGSVLGSGDLVATDFDPERVPSGAVRDPATVVGRTLAAPMTRGEVMTRVRTLAPGLLRGYPDTTAVPLRITDAAVVDLLRVGDRVSFVVADPDGRGTPSRLVDDVPVIAIPRVHTSGFGTSTPGRLVVAAIPSGQASEVAAAAATSILIPVWTR
jgi:pilus assembly protein CpaB